MRRQIIRCPCFRHTAGLALRSSLRALWLDHLAFLTLIALTLAGGLLAFLTGLADRRRS